MEVEISDSVAMQRFPLFLSQDSINYSFEEVPASGSIQRFSPLCYCEDNHSTTLLGKKSQVLYCYQVEISCCYIYEHSIFCFVGIPGTCTMYKDFLPCCCVLIQSMIFLKRFLVLLHLEIPYPVTISGFNKLFFKVDSWYNYHIENPSPVLYDA